MDRIKLRSRIRKKLAKILSQHKLRDFDRLSLVDFGSINYNFLDPIICIVFHNNQCIDIEKIQPNYSLKFFRDTIFRMSGYDCVGQKTRRVPSSLEKGPSNLFRKENKKIFKIGSSRDVDIYGDGLAIISFDKLTRKNVDFWNFALIEALNPIFHMSHADYVEKQHYNKLEIYKLDEDELFNIISEEPWILRFIDNPSIAVQRAAIKAHPWNCAILRSKKIKLSPEIRKLAIELHGRSIAHFKDATEEEQLLSVAEDESALGFIKKPSTRVKLHAVKHHGTSIRFITDPSSEVISAAIKDDPNCIQYIDSKWRR